MSVSEADLNELRWAYAERIIGLADDLRLWNPRGTGEEWVGFQRKQGELFAAIDFYRALPPEAAS